MEKRLVFTVLKTSKKHVYKNKWNFSGGGKTLLRLVGNGFEGCVRVWGAERGSGINRKKRVLL